MAINKTTALRVITLGYVSAFILVAMFIFSPQALAGGDGPGDSGTGGVAAPGSSPTSSTGAGVDNGTSVGEGSGVGVGDAGAPGGAGPGSSGPGDGSGSSGSGADGGGGLDSSVGGTGCSIPEEFGGCPPPTINSGCNEPGGCPEASPTTPSTPTSPPTPPTPPSFSGSGGSGSGANISIIGGNSATLTFACSDSTSSSGVNFSTGGAPSGSVVVSPTESTQFTVICSNGGQNFVNVNVFWPVLDISANPDRVKPENTSLITWSTIGDDDILSCSVTGPNFFADGKSGSKTTAPITEESTYTLTCPTTAETLSESVTVKLAPIFEEF